MKTKIIPFPGRHFERKKQPALTSLMIVALLAAYEKQKNKILFGPAPVKGSFTSLVGRGLIIRREVTVNKRKELLWQVTNEGIAMLKVTGIKLPVKVYAVDLCI